MTAPNRSLTLGHWNVGGRKTADVVARVTALWQAHGLDALCLNEVGDQDVALRQLANSLSAGLLNGDPKKPGSGREAILYRRSRLAPKGDLMVVECHGRLKGDPRAAGAKVNHGYFGPKYVQAQEFSDLESARSPIVATMHPVPSVRFPRQHALAARHFHGAADWVTSTHGSLLLSGDMNAEARNGLLDPLRAAGLTCSQVVLPELPTFGHSAIDQVWTRGFTLESQLDVDEAWDHDALVVRGHYSKP